MYINSPSKWGWRLLKQITVVFQNPIIVPTLNFPGDEE